MVIRMHSFPAGNFYLFTKKEHKIGLLVTFDSIQDIINRAFTVDFDSQSVKVHFNILTVTQ